jgi:hypothetical protein
MTRVRPARLPPGLAAGAGEHVRADRPNVERELVVDEHRDGSPHFTVDGEGKVRHYADGCSVARRARALGSGPAQVATDAYRHGWNAIWGPQGGGAPS